MNNNGLPVFPDRIVRWVECSDLEVRNSVQGRTIHGLLVPFDTPTRIAGLYDETFVRGAFAKTIDERGHRVKLTVGHRMDRLPIGRATSLREDAAGLVGEFLVTDTADGNDALQRVNDGAVDSFSIEFVPTRSEWTEDRDAVTRLEAKLLGASLVAYPAYDEALVAGVRSLIDLTAAMEQNPELRDRVNTLLRDYLQEHHIADVDAAPDTRGTSTDSNDTPPPAGHLSDDQRSQAEAVQASLARLIGAVPNGPNGEDGGEAAGDR
jgi:HK97 family phage prohead protease